MKYNNSSVKTVAILAPIKLYNGIRIKFIDDIKNCTCQNTKHS